MSESFNSDLFKNDILTESNDMPFYQKILTFIRHQIQSGTLKPGDMLPPESELCNIYGVSRTTIRLAMDQLAEEKLITRQRGKGSYISNPKLQRNLNHLYSFTEDMKNMGLNPYSKIIESCLIKNTGNISEILKLSPDSDIFKLVRIRYADKEPILLETSYIPYYLCSGILQEDFTTVSLYSMLQFKFKLQLSRAVETYEAIKLDKNTAKLLGCSPSSSAFNIHRTGYLDSGIPYEYTNSSVRSDKCIFTLELWEGKKQAYFSRKITP
jgi:Transcriptional regulators